MIRRYPCFRKPPSLLRFMCCNYYVFFLKEQGQLFRGGRARFTPVVGRLPHPKTTNLRLLQTTFLSLLSVWLSRKVWAQRFTVHVSSQMRLPLSLSWPLSSGFHFLFGLSFLDWTGMHACMHAHVHTYMKEQTSQKSAKIQRERGTGEVGADLSA